MPYGVFRTGTEEKPYCVFKIDDEGNKTGDSLGCHGTEEAANDQIAAIGASAHSGETGGKAYTVASILGSVIKAASVGSLLESKVHAAFTLLADRLYGVGTITKEERLELSKAIGKSLDKLAKTITSLGLEGRSVGNEEVDALFAAKGTIQDTLVSPQTTGLKALGNGRVGGYAVLFSPDKKKDMVGDFFQRGRSGFYWEGKEARSALYHHGLDSTLKKRRLGVNGRGWEFGHEDEVGLWVEHQLNMRDDYERAIYKMSKQGKLGLSSGTAAHLIERDMDGCLSGWPIMEISYTPTPAEPRTRVVPLRSIEVVPFKTLLGEMPDSEVGTGRPNARGFVPARRKRRLARSLYQLQGVKTMEMTVESLTEQIAALIPEIGEGQMTKLTALLRLAFGDVSADASAEPVPEGTTEEMRAAFGLVTYIDPYKMSDNIETCLDAIGQVMDLTDEQEAQIVSILELALGSVSSDVEEEDMYEDEEEDMYEEDEEIVLDEEELEEEIRALVQDELDYQDRRRRPRSSSRRGGHHIPPYNFGPRESEERPSPRKAATMLRYGEMDAAVKAVANDVYGPDYSTKRFAQQQAFGAFIRRGKGALDSAAQRSMKTVILTPAQLKAYALSGMSVTALKTDMSNIIDELGGFLVPEDFRMDMIARLPGITVVRGRAEATTTGSDMMVRIKKTGGDDRYPGAVRVSWVGDTPAAGSADTNPTYGVERTPIHIAKATVHVPMALLEDSPYPIVQEINQDVSLAYAIDEDEQFLIGDSNAKPSGMLPGGINLNSRIGQAVSGHASQLNNFDAIYDVQYELAQQYWPNACWVMNRATAKVVRTLKDGNGDYLWEQSNQVGQPPNLIGYPVFMSEAMPDIGANTFPMIYGDIGQGYQIADRVGMSVIRDDVTKAEEDMVKFVFRRRLGGQIKGEWALVCLKIAAS